MSQFRTNIILGVDPGLSGALAWLAVDPSGAIELLNAADMPTAAAKQGKTMKQHILFPVLSDLIGNPLYNTNVAVIEEVHAMPGQGVTSMFRFGYAAGAVAGVCAGHNIPTTFLRPKVWQSVAGMRQGKDAGRLRAMQLFPRQTELFRRVKDHNRADAALIAYAHALDVASGKALITG